MAGQTEQRASPNHQVIISDRHQVRAMIMGENQRNSPHITTGRRGKIEVAGRKENRHTARTSHVSRGW